MAALAFPSSPPTQRSYTDSHHTHPLRSSQGHVTHHVTNHMATPTNELSGKRRGGVGKERSRDGGEGSGESTTEEVDAAPNESSTTTDTVPEACEPVDFIECGPSIARAYSTSAIPVNGHHKHGNMHRVIGPSSSFQGYDDNWSMFVQMEAHNHQTPGYLPGVRGRSGSAVVGPRVPLPRKGKLMMRGGSKERQRVPHPAPRQMKAKNQYTRPVPISRKRRFSGRLSRPSHSVSEGDMAMADEMGEGEGEEGADDGFVDCVGEGVKRRNKKRTGGLHMVFPTMGQGNTASPPSSPSATPVSSRRRTPSRKSRVKRSRKSMKQPKLASADISTQETTTPGPNSSDTTDTDSHDDGLAGGPGATAVGGCSSESYDHNGVAEHHLSHSGTPNLPSASPESSTHPSDSEASGGLEYSSAVEDALEGERVVSHKKRVENGSRADFACNRRVPENGTSVSKFNSNKNLNGDACEVSDTDKASNGADQYSLSIRHKLSTHWSAKRLDSDFSTAPLSSETSDMDTSGHEKLASDGGGSTSDLTSLSRDSRASDISSDVFSSSLQQKLSSASASGSATRPSSGERTNSNRRPPMKTVSGGSSPVQKAAVIKEEASTSSASPPVSKRPLKASLSSPLRGERYSPPKSISAADSRVSLAGARVPPRPKPPVAVKPVVKPKPPILVSTTDRSGARSPQSYQRTKLHSAGDSDSVKFTMADADNAVEGDEPEQKGSFSGGSRTQIHGIRKASSDTNVLAMEKGAGRPVISSISTSFVSQRLSNVREETEDKESDSEKLAAASVTRPARFSPTPRPHLLPTKSKLPVTSLSKSMSPTPALPLKPKIGSSAQQRVGSESASSLPSSPLAVKRKPVPPQKPVVLPKKPGLLLQLSSSEGNLTSKDLTNTSTPASDVKVSTGVVSPPEKPHTRRRPYNRTGTIPTQLGQAVTPPSGSPSITPSVSPTPPLLPPRSPVLQQRNKDLDRSSGSLSASQPTLRTAAICGSSSSSQEDTLPPPVPSRRGVEKKNEAFSPTDRPSTPQNSPPPDGTNGAKQPPPVARRLKSSPRESLDKKSPRRPPPNPPLSPSPPPVPPHTKTMGRSSISDTCTVDPASQKRHSLSHNYEVLDGTSEESKRFERLYRQSVKSSMKVSATETSKKPTDTNQSQASTSTRKPRATHYEMTFLDPERPPKLLKSPPTSEQGDAAPTAVSPLSSDDAPPPLPSQPIPKRKDRMQQNLLKRGPIKARESSSPTSQRSDEGVKSDTQSVSSECSIWSQSPSSKDKVYDVVPDASCTAPNDSKKSVKGKASGFFRKMTRTDLKSSNPDLNADSSTQKREAKSFSAFTFRRSNSDRFKKNKLPIATPVVGNAVTMARRSVHRTPSVDKLDDRMERSVRLSNPEPEVDSSSDEDEETVESPTQQGLPQPPLQRYTESPKASKREDIASSYIVPADEEPLYQYINTAEFLRTPQENVKTGLTKNQLEIARQLSSRRLWCEQPEIIKSGVLDDLSEDEKKLQEAIFEVVTTEATYLRSLDVLIEHFMEDPGMNPHLPEGRRVLDKRQHHVIFSNVQEVREISARFLEELRARQNETAVIKGIADIVLEYAESKFDCYIRYCTNQIYQTRELQECLEKNVMFRDYLKRLEQHKRCQHLSMQSFLLLPMQRITRLPLLILAILNKTPLDHPDHRLVENALRTVQKLVTECNDGARRMERTEQLHNIHQQLDFGKLKPFPLVSASRQLERRGTLVRLKVEQKLFGRNQIQRKQLYLFAFTDLIIISKRKKDPKGEYVYKVVDYASRAVVTMEDIGVHPGMSFPKHTFGEQDTVANATWAVSTAGEKYAFLLILLDNVYRQSEKYILVAQNDTDKTRWMESLATPESQREDEKIYQTWDCPQVQAVYDYKAAQPDELSLERGDVVKVYRKMADGWYEGERLRDLQWGWFPSNFTAEIENEHTRARNLRETHRLLSLPYSAEEYAAKLTTLR